MIQSFGEPGVWAEPDVGSPLRDAGPLLTHPRQLVRILGGYGALVVERTGSDVWAFLLSHDILWKYRVSTSLLVQEIVGLTKTTLGQLHRHQTTHLQRHLFYEGPALRTASDEYQVSPAIDCHRLHRGRQFLPTRCSSVEVLIESAQAHGLYAEGEMHLPPSP